MSVPTAHDVRKYLKGYCVDLESTFAVTGDTVIGSATISNIDTRDIEEDMRISGTGIPTGSTVQSVDSVGQYGQITISINATANGTTVAITLTYYTETTDEWIANRRDNFVIPAIEHATGLSITSETEIEEYYSGNGSSILILNRRPINSIENITYTSIPSEVQTGNLLQSVELISEEGILKSKTNFNEGSYDPIFAKGINNIKVTYKYGYSSTPNDICELITIMLAKKILVYIGSRSGGGSISQSSYSRNFGNRGKYTDLINELDKEIYMILRKYSTGVVGA